MPVGEYVQHYLVFSYDRRWLFRKRGAKRALRRFKTKKEAISFAKKWLKTHAGECSVHGLNGKREKWIYSLK